MKFKMKDLTNQRFGRLLVIRPTDERKNECVLWICQCDCGNTVKVKSSDLNRGHTQSCGCLHNEQLARRTRKYDMTHGDSRGRLYCIWINMKQRCGNPNAWEYSAYGGRGISVCDEWLYNFIAFRDWALLNGYEKTLTIDRIDNDKGYCPENCRWIPQSEQYKNTQRSK